LVFYDVKKRTPKEILVPTLAVIAHYHPQGKVTIDLVNLMKHLHQNRVTIVFVSTCLSEISMSRIQRFGTVIRRDNFGYDFWSYKVGLESVDTRSFDRILFLNSSFVTTDPVLLCSDFLEAPNETGLRGISISHEFHPHVQSFWVAFEGRDLIRSDAFKAWWQAMTPISDRQEVIQNYEIGMSRYFSEQGYSLKAIFQATAAEKFRAINLAFACNWWSTKVQGEAVTIRLSLANTLNPTYFMWQPLVERHGLIKRDTLNKPSLWPDLQEWLSKLSPPDPRYTMIHDAFPDLIGNGRRKTSEEVRQIDHILDRGVDASGEPRPFTAREFFERSDEAGFNQNNDGYRSLFKNFSRWCVEQFQFNSALEIGAGPGYLTFLLNRLGIDCIGVDGNDYSMRFFQKLHPKYADRYRLDPEFKNDYPEREALFAIECFEHIPDPALELLMNKVTTEIRPRLIFFSSTPHPDPDPIADFQWGHINLKQPDEWDRFFDGFGYRRRKEQPPITQWACVYEKVS
jgi:SAM-dependent methyltransferase